MTSDRRTGRSYAPSLPVRSLMPAPVVPVTAVVVAHDGLRWLPEALGALAAQTVRPARVVTVDTGSTDGSDALLRRLHGQHLTLPPDTGYPAAVAAALAAVPADQQWIWLLHDDCAPDPDVLEMLLAVGQDQPSAAVLGPKSVHWHSPRLLREVGATCDASGRRRVDVEPDELDQGQHDGTHDVLAVDTAGALVRRDVWDSLGGLDVAFPLLGDDLDLGWRVNAAGHRVVVVPAARVQHAAATATGERFPGADPLQVTLAERRAAARLALAHAAGARLAAALPCLLLLAALRAVALLLARAPRAALAELRAVPAVLARPTDLRALRRARARTSVLPPRALRPLLAAPWTGLRRRLAQAVDRLGGPGPSSPAGAGEGGLLRRVLSRPEVQVLAVLAAVAVLAERALLGGGVLGGGRLLPPPDGARDLWTAYLTGPADGLGMPAAPFVAVLALVATVLLGKASLAVDLLLLGAVPLAGAVGYRVAARLVAAPVLRSWAAATWALLPVATGAVAAGRLDAVAVHVALPALLLAGYGLLTGDPRHDGWRRAWALGLGLTAVAAFAPLVWPLTAVLLVGTGVLAVAVTAPARRPLARRRALACALAAAVPALLLLPWSWSSWTSPGAVLHGPGRITAELVDPALPAWHLLLLSPGGPGLPAVLTTSGLVLAALAGLLRQRRARLAAGGWALALGGLATALVLSRTSADGAGVWPAVPLDLAAAGLLASALVAAEGVRERLARSTFGWRQLTAVALVVAAAAVPVLAAASWVARGADGPLRRTAVQALPAFARAELAATPGARALVLAPRTDGAVAYALGGAHGVRLGDADRGAAGAQRAGMDALVADLLRPRGTDPAAGLAARSIRFVALPTAQPLPVPVTQALDAQPGLDREGGALLWRVRATDSATDSRMGSAASAAPAAQDGGRRRGLLLQAVLLLAVVVLAAPGGPARRRTRAVR
jgi:GT2 family glycosyltransferase